MPKRWRRSASAPGPTVFAPVVPAAHVVSVVTDGSDIVAWNFDAVVTAISDASGLTIGGDTVTGYVGGDGTTSLQLEFNSNHESGEPWTCDPTVMSIVFSPPHNLQAGSGTTA